MGGSGGTTVIVHRHDGRIISLYTDCSDETTVSFIQLPWLHNKYRGRGGPVQNARRDGLSETLQTGGARESGRAVIRDEAGDTSWISDEVAKCRANLATVLVRTLATLLILKSQRERTVRSRFPNNDSEPDRPVAMVIRCRFQCSFAETKFLFQDKSLHNTIATKSSSIYETRSLQMWWWRW